MECNHEETKLITTIKESLQKNNIDNISRTVAYEKYYKKNNEIIWAFLASVVSRNAGWNMTDLKGEVFVKIIPEKLRNALFYTYETANWLIFSDAYPQLLLYEYSKETNKPYFHLLSTFHVSKFMEKEWNFFWEKGDINRLCVSLIINEQNIIQKPVIEAPLFKKKVFGSIPFAVEDRLHFSTVIFPTITGKLYGFSVHGFKKTRNRIELGKRLAWLLFQSPEKELFHDFFYKVPHTGSRYDYEQFVRRVGRKRTPTLRSAFPIVSHITTINEDWYQLANKKKIDQLYSPAKLPKQKEFTDWYYRKQRQLIKVAWLKQWISSLLKIHQK